MPFKSRFEARSSILGWSSGDTIVTELSPSRAKKRLNQSTPASHRRGLALYIERHYDELMALVEERRRPEYADQWEEI